MWHTFDGPRILLGDEARVFGNAAWQLVDEVRNSLPNPGQPESDRFPTGVALFDQLSAKQAIVLIEQVVRFLLDPLIDPPPVRSALLDATVAAIYARLLCEVEIELDIADSEEREDMSRTLIVKALRSEVGYWPEEISSVPDRDSIDPDEWQMAIESLRDRVLTDEDWQLNDLALDLPPEKSQKIKQSMGIDPDYFVGIPPDATHDDARDAWVRLLYRLTGRIPESWRFDGNPPVNFDDSQDDHGRIPEVTGIADHLDAEQDFTESEIEEVKLEPDLEIDEPTNASAKFVNQIPVLLSDVVSEMESQNDEFCMFVNVQTGKFVMLPSDLILHLEENEEIEGYYGWCDDDLVAQVKDYLRASDHYFGLPSEFDIHEWSIMRDFCETMRNEDQRSQLLDAIHGGGAFRNFKSTVGRLDLLGDWYQYKEKALEAIAIVWLESNEILWTRERPSDDVPF